MNVQDTQICQAAASNASADPQLAGIDPLTILGMVSAVIAALQSIFSKCAPAQATAETTQEHVQAAFHEDTSSYDDSVLGPAVVESKKQLRRDRHVRNLGKDGRAQAQALALHSLDAVRDGSADAAQECFAACAAQQGA